MRTLHTFHGGIHPPEHKSESNRDPIAQAALPKRLVVSLRQHMGTPAKALVKAGDTVLKGQKIGDPAGALSSAIHAPTSGTVVAVDYLPVPHPSGLPDLCVVIESDGRDSWIEHAPLDYRSRSKAEVVEHLRESGIVGLGGAVFPTHIKVNTGETPIQTLILNGAECEPWITSDDLLMRERAAEIVQGIEILRWLVNPAETVIGIEDNKPEAITAMRHACEGTGIEVAEIPTLYPSGGEKQLIKILTGKEVPSGGRPYQIGVVCVNVATAYTIHRAVNHGEPMISRVITLTGNVNHPRNLEALIGTSFAELLEQAEGARADTHRYIMGGPMMGLELATADLPMLKASNCLIAASPTLFPEQDPAMPCARCTHCAQSCPVNLLPYEMYWAIRAKNFEKAREKYSLMDCIECGCCSYGCGSRIPLVQYFRYAKSELAALDREKRAAEVSRQRSEAKQMRQEREKAERAAKLAAKNAAAAKAADPAAEEAKKKAIQEAAARAEAARGEVAPQNTDNLSPEAQAKIAEVDARRAAEKNESAQDA